MSFAVAAGATVALIGGIIGGSKARRAKEASERKAANLERRMKGIKRQEITNPYEGVKDLSSMINNPYANLQVATKAAEMQGEEADIALSSSLDALRATGGSAGGATALAQEAARSKRGVAASIEQQEAQNERLRAHGEQQAQQARMAEQQRLQSAQAMGAAYQFEAQEDRTVADLSRASAMMQGASQQYMDARASGGLLGGILKAAAGGIGTMVAVK